jgi:hypothetical protein
LGWRGAGLIPGSTSDGKNMHLCWRTF